MSKESLIDLAAQKIVEQGFNPATARAIAGIAANVFMGAPERKQVCESVGTIPTAPANPNTLNALTQIREALCAFEFMDHEDAGWLLMRSSLKQARGAGSVRLEDGWLKGMRLLFKERDAALAMIDGLIENAAKLSEIPVNKSVCLPPNEDKKVCPSEDADLEDVSKIVHCHDCGKRLAAEEIKYLTNTCSDCERKAWDGVLHEGEERPVPPQDKAYGYARRLFKHLAPQCKPLPDTLGVLKQLDNYITGLREPKREAGEDTVTTSRDRYERNIDERNQLREKSNAEMLRVKMCEHIAEGEEGWNKPENRNICPSTMAVAKLRDVYEEAHDLLKILHGAMLGLQSMSNESAKPRFDEYIELGRDFLLNNSIEVGAPHD